MGCAERYRRGAAKRIGHHINTWADDGVESVLARQARAWIAFNGDIVGVCRRRRICQQRHGPGAAVIVEIDDVKIFVEKIKERVLKRVRAGAIDGEHIEFAGGEIDLIDIELARRINRAVKGYFRRNRRRDFRCYNILT